MIRFVRNAGLALSLLAFAGCRDSTGPNSVRAARMLWASQNITDYSYVGSQLCFCTVPEGLVRVTVLNGKVTSAIDLATNTQVSSSGWLTVDELFDLAEQAHPQVLEFDAQFGFPKRIEICCLANDSGSVYTVSGFEMVAFIQ